MNHAVHIGYGGTSAAQTRGARNGSNCKFTRSRAVSYQFLELKRPGHLTTDTRAVVESLCEKGRCGGVQGTDSSSFTDRALVNFPPFADLYLSVSAADASLLTSIFTTTTKTTQPPKHRSLGDTSRLVDSSFAIHLRLVPRLLAGAAGILPPNSATHPLTRRRSCRREAASAARSTSTTGSVGLYLCSGWTRSPVCTDV
jgi:hypothetical protein